MRNVGEHRSRLVGGGVEAQPGRHSVTAQQRAQNLEGLVVPLPSTRPVEAGQSMVGSRRAETDPGHDTTF